MNHEPTNDLSTRRVSRKDFFREIFGLFREAVPAAFAPADGFLLPPGAASQADYLQTCTGCYHCVSACPHQALRVCRDAGAPLEGYPVIDPREQPCLRCTDFPCTAACSSGALLPERSNRPLGTAEVLLRNCLAAQGHFCQSCISNCPLTGRAIQRGADGVPVVDTAHCDGCGQCVSVCPAEPAGVVVRRPGLPD